MGKQVRFFNFASDLAALDALLIDCGVSIVRSSSPTKTPVQLPSLRHEGDSAAALLLVRSNDLAELCWRHLPSRGVWTVDKDSSPVIEYTPGYTRDGQPRFVSSRGPGRMWFQTSHWVDDQLVRADAEFVAWADRLLRWVKSHWDLIESDYYSPRAADLWKATWQVVLDEPYEGPAADQIGRWRRHNDPATSSRTDPFTPRSAGRPVLDHDDSPSRFAPTNPDPPRTRTYHGRRDALTRATSNRRVGPSQIDTSRRPGCEKGRPG